MIEEPEVSHFGLIPEFYYDLIGRIVPGATALLLLIGANWNDIAPGGVELSKLADIQAGASFLLFVVFVFLSYLLGFFGNGMGRYVCRVLRRRYWTLLTDEDLLLLRSTARFLGIPLPAARPRPAAYERLFAVLHDYLKVVHPHGAAVLVKISAETYLLASLWLTAIATIGVAVLRGIDVLWLLVLAAVLVFLTLATRAANDRWIERHLSFLRYVLSRQPAALACNEGPRPVGERA